MHGRGEGDKLIERPPERKQQPAMRTAFPAETGAPQSCPTVSGSQSPGGPAVTRPQRYVGGNVASVLENVSVKGWRKELRTLITRLLHYNCQTEVALASV